MDSNPLQRNEKFFAFCLLLLVIAGLVLLASSFDRGAANDIVAQGKMRIIDGAITGLLTILGMCAQALFRIGQTDRDNAEALKTLADKTPSPPPAEPVPVKVVQPDSQPVPVAEQASSPDIDAAPR